MAAENAKNAEAGLGCALGPLQRWEVHGVRLAGTHPGYEDACAMARRDGWDPSWIWTYVDVSAVLDGFWFDVEAADVVPAFVETFCVHIQGALRGQPLKLAPWVGDRVLRPVFGWRRPNGTRRIRRAYVEVPRKSAKSTTGSGLGIYMMIGDGEPGASVVSAAADKRQARKVFGDARSMVMLSEELSEELTVYRDSIFHEGSGSLWEVISADADTKHGQNDSAIIFDELHAQPDEELWQVLTSGVSSRDEPLLFAITTAGAEANGICWDVREQALAVLGGVENYDVYGYVRCADRSDVWWRLETWIKANPGLELDHWIEEEREKGKGKREKGGGEPRNTRTTRKEEGDGAGAAPMQKAKCKTDNAKRGKKRGHHEEPEGHEGGERKAGDRRPEEEEKREVAASLGDSLLAMTKTGEVAASLGDSLLAMTGEDGHESGERRRRVRLREDCPFRCDETSPEGYIRALKRWLYRWPHDDKSLRLSYLVGLAEEALRSNTARATFFWLHLNLWGEAIARWLNLDQWDACEVVFDAEALKGRRCYGGLDLASKIDVAAFVLVFPPEEGTEGTKGTERTEEEKRGGTTKGTKEDPDNPTAENRRLAEAAKPPRAESAKGEGEDALRDRWCVLPYFWTPEGTAKERERVDGVPYVRWIEQGFMVGTPGNAIYQEAVKQGILELNEEFDIQSIGYDEWNAQKVAEELTEEGLTMVLMPQTFKYMSEGTKQVEVDVIDGKLAQNGNPVMRWMVGNCVVQMDTNANIRPDKRKSSEKIDGVVGLVMGKARAVVGDGKPRSKYEERELTVLGGAENSNAE